MNLFFKFRQIGIYITYIFIISLATACHKIEINEPILSDVSELTQNSRYILQDSVGLNCGTIASQDFLTERLGIKTYNLSSITDKIFMVYFHVIRKSDGTGGLTTSQVNQVLSNLQIGMEQTSICIVEKGRSFIDNNTFFSGNPDANFDNIVATNRQSNAINVYLLPTGAISFGKADGIPSNALVLSGSYVLTPVVAHEFGHCLGLFHTHRGTAGIELGGGPAQCPELVNGSNSSTCGDYVTDTPADPKQWSISSCAYIGTGTDANGAHYSPLTDNAMSYVLPSCLQSFTPLQIARMHTAIDNSAILRNAMSQITGPNIVCTTGTYSISNFPSGAAITWSVSGNINISGPTNNSTVSVAKISDGPGSITAQITTSCGTISVTKSVIVGTGPMSVSYNSGIFVHRSITNCANLQEGDMANWYEGDIQIEQPLDGTVTWTRVGGGVNAQITGSGRLYHIGMRSGQATYNLTITNGCGSITKTITFYTNNATACP
ncbi:M43 family zinc metalloprotease [Parapedobacter sp. GCM10030251]|uniref:M43 family zinc metalloprotease n=1 Tax=Parapedobacter sp. GCM10030251 TaxID=3273419 RepID=UPI00360E7AE2